MTKQAKIKFIPDKTCPTPRTDEAIKQRQRAIWGSYPVTVGTVAAEFARELERENIAMRELISEVAREHCDEEPCCPWCEAALKFLQSNAEVSHRAERRCDY